MVLFAQDGRVFELRLLTDWDISVDNEISALTYPDRVKVILGKYENFDEVEYTLSCLKAYHDLLRPTFRFPKCGYCRDYEVNPNE